MNKNKRTQPTSKKEMTRGEKMAAKYNKSAENAEMGENINRVTFEAGKTTLVHLIDMDYTEGFFHFITDPEGNNKKITCRGGLTKGDRKVSQEICPACAEWKESNDSDIAPKHRYMYNAIQGEIVTRKQDKKKIIRWDKLVRLLDIGPQIFNQIAVIQLDEEYPDVDEIYLKVTRKGKGLKTEYQVLASPKKSSLPDDLEGDDYELDDFIEETPMDDIYAALGIDPEEQTQSEPEEESLEEFNDEPEKSSRRTRTQSSSSKPEGRTRRTRQSEPEEEEFGNEEPLENFEDNLEEVNFE